MIATKAQKKPKETQVIMLIFGIFFVPFVAKLV